MKTEKFDEMLPILLQTLCTDINGSCNFLDLCEKIYENVEKNLCNIHKDYEEFCECIWKILCRAQKQGLLVIKNEGATSCTSIHNEHMIRETMSSTKRGRPRKIPTPVKSKKISGDLSIKTRKSKD